MSDDHGPKSEPRPIGGDSDRPHQEAAQAVRRPTVRMAAVSGQPLDKRHRPFRDLRISLTDKCNFRCTYCMPREVFGTDYEFLPHSSLLSFEEIERVARQAVSLGVRKLRLTGGEPLLRRNIEVLIAMLVKLRTPEGDPVELTLTTNGTLLGRKAQALERRRPESRYRQPGCAG